jgi:hypothetical protein
MKLISYLQEAADTPLADLRAALKKDTRVNKIFTKNLQLDEIINPVEFLQTLRFYVLNNRHVIEFVRARNGVSTNLSNWSFKRARELRPEDLTQQWIESLQDLVSTILRENTSVSNATISRKTLDSLSDFVQNQRSWALSASNIKELEGFPSLRPDHAVRLYRGLNFDNTSFEESTSSYTGKLQVGSGLKFLRSIREGKRVADLNWDSLTTWVTTKEEAINTAFHGDGGMWRNNRDKLHGAMGFVISTLAQPEQIVVDTSLIGKFSAPHKVILREGNYTCRVIHKYTKEGEVDPTEKHSDSSELVNAIESLEMFGHIFKPPFTSPSFNKFNLSAWNQSKIDSFKQLIEPSAKEKIAKSFDILRDFYNAYLLGVTKEQLSDLAADSRYDLVAAAAKKIVLIMAIEEPHPTLQDDRYGRPRKVYVPRHDLVGTEFVDANKPSSLIALKPFIIKPVRFTQWNIGGLVNAVLRMGGNNDFDKLHLSAGKVQQKQIDIAIAGFFSVIGEPQPATRQEAADKIEKYVAEAEQNARVLSVLWDVREALDSLKG